MLQYAHFSYQQRNETTTGDGDDGGDDNDDDGNDDDNDGDDDDNDGDDDGDDDSRLVDHMTTWWDRQLSRLLLYSSYTSYHTSSSALVPVTFLSTQQLSKSSSTTLLRSLSMLSN